MGSMFNFSPKTLAMIFMIGGAVMLGSAFFFFLTPVDAADPFAPLVGAFEAKLPFLGSLALAGGVFIWVADTIAGRKRAAEHQE